jgi:HK97 family phage major capsid protein
MKREFFNPAMARFVEPITGKSYRSSRSLRFGSACFKSDGGSGDDDEEEQTKQLLVKVRAATIKEMNERGASKETLTAVNGMIDAWKLFPREAIEALANDKTGVMALLREQGLRIEKIENKTVFTAPQVLTIRQQLQNYIDGVGMENGLKPKEVVAQIRAGKQVALPALELNLRAATVPMTPANTIDSTGYVVGSSDYNSYALNDIPRRKLTFWDYITKGRTKSNVYRWVNKTNPQGAAGFIAPGVLKPFISFEIEILSATDKKVAAADKIALELLEDIDQFESWVKDELRYQVALKVNTVLMTSDGTNPDEPTGIQHLSVAFTQTGLQTTNPTYADAIRAVVAQMRSGNIDGDITVFINPIDAANMDMAKATTSGVYMLAPFSTANGKTIGGATVVEDYNVPVGYLQAAFLQYFKILILKDMYITFGWENDDFRKNLLTYLCEMRLIQAFNTQYTGAFVYDTFVNILAAIAA